jgi:hypothetical protein
VFPATITTNGRARPAFGAGSDRRLSIALLAAGAPSARAGGPAIWAQVMMVASVPATMMCGRMGVSLQEKGRLQERGRHPEPGDRLRAEGGPQAAGAAWAFAGVLQAQPSPQRQAAPQPQSQGWHAQGSQGQVIISISMGLRFGDRRVGKERVGGNVRYVAFYANERRRFPDPQDRHRRL